MQLQIVQTLPYALSADDRDLLRDGVEPHFPDFGLALASDAAADLAAVGSADATTPAGLPRARGGDGRGHGASTGWRSSGRRTAAPGSPPAGRVPDLPHDWTHVYAPRAPLPRLVMSDAAASVRRPYVTDVEVAAEITWNAQRVLWRRGGRLLRSVTLTASASAPIRHVVAGTVLLPERHARAADPAASAATDAADGLPQLPAVFVLTAPNLLHVIPESGPVQTVILPRDAMTMWALDVGVLLQSEAQPAAAAGADTDTDAALSLSLFSALAGDVTPLPMPNPVSRDFTILAVESPYVWMLCRGALAARPAAAPFSLSLRGQDPDPNPDRPSSAYYVVRGTLTTQAAVDATPLPGTPLVETTAKTQTPSHLRFAKQLAASKHAMLSSPQRPPPPPASPPTALAQTPKRRRTADDAAADGSVLDDRGHDDDASPEALAPGTLRLATRLVSRTPLTIAPAPITAFAVTLHRHGPTRYHFLHQQTRLTTLTVHPPVDALTRAHRRRPGVDVTTTHDILSMLPVPSLFPDTQDLLVVTRAGELVIWPRGDVAAARPCRMQSHPQLRTLRSQEVLTPLRFLPVAAAMVPAADLVDIVAQLSPADGIMSPLPAASPATPHLPYAHHSVRTMLLRLRIPYMFASPLAEACLRMIETASPALAERLLYDVFDRDDGRWRTFRRVLITTAMADGAALSTWPTVFVKLFQYLQELRLSIVSEQSYRMLGKLLYQWSVKWSLDAFSAYLDEHLGITWQHLCHHTMGRRRRPERPVTVSISSQSSSAAELQSLSPWVFDVTRLLELAAAHPHDVDVSSLPDSCSRTHLLIQWYALVDPAIGSPPAMPPALNSPAGQTWLAVTEFLDDLPIAVAQPIHAVLRRLRDDPDRHLTPLSDRLDGKYQRNAGIRDEAAQYVDDLHRVDLARPAPWLKPSLVGTMGLSAGPTATAATGMSTMGAAAGPGTSVNGMRPSRHACGAHHDRQLRRHALYVGMRDSDMVRECLANSGVRQTVTIQAQRVVAATPLFADVAKDTQTSRAAACVLFSRDARMREVNRLLSNSDVGAPGTSYVTAMAQHLQRLLRHAGLPAEPPPGDDPFIEQELVDQQQTVLGHYAKRALTLVFGRALLTVMGCHDADDDSAIEKLRPVRLAAVLPPHNQEVALQPKALGAYTDWHLFHVGVAAALSNPPSDVDRVTDRMLTKYADLGPLSYRGEALGALDGGYLVGLGLLGHLRALSTWQIMNLLSHKHELLLIGILLGTAAAYYGTMHDMTIKLLTVHLKVMQQQSRPDVDVVPDDDMNGFDETPDMAGGIVAAARSARGGVRGPFHDAAWDHVTAADFAQRDRGSGEAILRAVAHAHRETDGGANGDTNDPAAAAAAAAGGADDAYGGGGGAPKGITFNDLFFSLQTQVVVSIAIGLVYAETGHTSMLQVVFHELYDLHRDRFEMQDAHRENYALGLGFSMGLIQLGRGGLDVGMLQRMRVCLTAETADVHVTRPATLMAMALVYLNTNDPDALRVVALLQTPQQSTNMPPYHVLLTRLTEGLIRLRLARPTSAWLRRSVSHRLRDALQQTSLDAMARPAASLADQTVALHELAGAALTLGLKYAGTANAAATQSLWSLYFAMLGDLPAWSRATDEPANATSGGAAALNVWQLSDDPRSVPSDASAAARFRATVFRGAQQQCSLLVLTALSLVLAGTGHLDLLTHLRARIMDPPPRSPGAAAAAAGMGPIETTFGDYQALHMALGLLFLGGGSVRIDRRPRDIALLLISFFPRWPRDAGSARAYPSAWRHLWALSAFSQMLTTHVCDPQNGLQGPQSEPVPVELTFANGQRVRAVTPFPCRTHRVTRVVVCSDRFLPLALTIADLPSAARATWRQSGIVYVQRHPGHAGYAHDAMGAQHLARVAVHNFLRVPTPGQLQLGILNRLRDLHLLTFVADWDLSTRASWSGVAKPPDRRGMLRELLHGCIVLDEMAALPLCVLLSLDARRFRGAHDAFLGLLDHHHRMRGRRTNEVSAPVSAKPSAMAPDPHHKLLERAALSVISPRTLAMCSERLLFGPRAQHALLAMAAARPPLADALALTPSASAGDAASPIPSTTASQPSLVEVARSATMASQSPAVARDVSLLRQWLRLPPPESWRRVLLAATWPHCPVSLEGIDVGVTALAWLQSHLQNEETASQVASSSQMDPSPATAPWAAPPESHESPSQ
ncbi:hypothetical protein CXG81DRAFT_18164 [Caulochytrium protostelioides]|uniref:Uncharacterized protein n=1 Tax=Caulochytrium protostelioides TaxID=1555241 RepID=A0A4P9X9U1_9FUNG|nr:hypothetical protein CXG81DRAFT_18164 [Caulochytrium protostelioides]|eukprot:RKP02123.1 hypothetical protein CXG81DRAFT_18164 [Caulochytrium protostelioides]